MWYYRLIPLSGYYLKAARSKPNYPTLYKESQRTDNQTQTGVTFFVGGSNFNVQIILILQYRIIFMRLFSLDCNTYKLIMCGSKLCCFLALVALWSFISFLWQAGAFFVSHHMKSPQSHFKGGQLRNTVLTMKILKYQTD